MAAVIYALSAYETPTACRYELMCSNRSRNCLCGIDACERFAGACESLYIYFRNDMHVTREPHQACVQGTPSDFFPTNFSQCFLWKWELASRGRGLDAPAIVLGSWFYGFETGLLQPSRVSPLSFLPGAPHNLKMPKCPKHGT